MLDRKFYLDNIADSLAHLSQQVALHNSINLYDINIISETFYADLLNIIKGWKLSNANSVEKNAPGVDLVDDLNKIAVQVTSDSSSDKIKHTIEEFISKRLYEKYNHLIVLILTKKKKYTAKFESKGLFQFDKSQDIWDIYDLINEINTLKTGEVKRVNDFLAREFTDKYRISKKTEANEVETIMNLIECISNNRKKPLSQHNYVVDPEYKIYGRFKDFADSLISQYQTLLAVYGTALSEVETLLGSDDARDIIIKLYLQELSLKYLSMSGNDPVKALNALVEFFENKLSENGKAYDSMAIKFYLINEIIKCSVFPNVKG